MKSPAPAPPFPAAFAVEVRRNLLAACRSYADERDVIRNITLKRTIRGIYGTVGNNGR